MLWSLLLIVLCQLLFTQWHPYYAVAGFQFRSPRSHVETTVHSSSEVASSVDLKVDR